MLRVIANAAPFKCHYLRYTTRYPRSQRSCVSITERSIISKVSQENLRNQSVIPHIWPICYRSSFISFLFCVNGQLQNNVCIPLERTVFFMPYYRQQTRCRQNLYIHRHHFKHACTNPLVSLATATGGFPATCKSISIVYCQSCSCVTAYFIFMRS